MSKTEQALESLRRAIHILSNWMDGYPASPDELPGEDFKETSREKLADGFSKTGKTDKDAGQKKLSAESAQSQPSTPPSDLTDQILQELAEKLKGNYPFHSPVYAGQMLKPPHPLAWSAYALTMLLNPNNHALDGGPPTSEMEKEVIPQLGGMFGYSQPMLGHLTSSGTIANLEALWIARSIHPGQAVAFSSQAHYTHRRMCEVLGVPFHVIDSDANGAWDTNQLKKVLPETGTLVVTIGTTGAGVPERLDLLLPLAREFGVRIHLDAAYGGYFRLLKGTGLIDDHPWELTAEADSIVIDPHKHGLQPYGCGCVLFKDPSVGRFYKHDSPYTYFSSDELHLGEISLECSRAGASAAALWATLKYFGLEEGGRMQQVMASCRKSALSLAEKIDKSEHFRLIYKPELDIIIYAPVPRRESGQHNTDDSVHTAVTDAATISKLSKAIFQEGMKAGPDGIFLSLYKLPVRELRNAFPELIPSSSDETVTVLRSVLMRQGQLNFTDELMRRLNECYARASAFG